MTAHNSTTQHPIVSYLKRCLRKVLRVDMTLHVFALYVLGHHVFTYRNYVIMSFQTGNYAGLQAPSGKITVSRITPERLSEFQRDDMDFATLKDKLTKYSGLCEFFGLWDENGEPAGHVGIMYKGGNDIGVFNVRNTPAHIVEVFVSEKHRRKGYCTMMLREVLRYLHDDKHIPRATLIVRVRNTPARLAYLKAGGTEDFHARTFRFCKINFPIHGFDL